MKLGLALVALAAAFCHAGGLAMVSSSQDGMILDLQVPAPEFGTATLAGSTYATITLPGADSYAEAGFPCLPVYRTWIEIPIGAEVGIRITDSSTGSFEIPGGLPVAPAAPPVPKSLDRDSFVPVFDSSVYISGNAWPSSQVRIVEAGMMRGRNLAIVEVMPVRWDPSDQSVEVLTGATITLTYEGGDVAGSFAQADRYAATGFEALLSGTVANYGTFEDRSDSPMGGYLIVAAPDYYETAMDAFVTWKMRSGYPVTLVSTAETGATATEIRNYILNAIQTWETPPQYVLLVGESNQVPGYAATEYSGVTDLYYVCLDDGGWMPDAFIGRFSVQNAGQCVLMAQRLIDYEQWNYAGSGSWMQSAGWIASSDNYSISEGTHNYCISTYTDPLGYTSDKLYPHTYGASAAQVTAAVNQGESMLTFSGHGSQTSWGDMAYGQGDFNQLTNEYMYPGVISHACLTGDYATGTCWAETWTRTPGRGGLWFWGSVPSTYWDQDDVQERAEYDYFLGQSIPWSMCWLDGGKLALYAYYSGGGMTKYYFEGYNLMGDPSAEMWTWQLAGGVPGTLSVTHPASISGTGPVTVTVSGATDDALVCLWKGDEVYERGFTENGSITMYVGPETTGDMLVTVRRHNYKPYLGVITVNGTGVGEGEGCTPLSISCPNPVLGQATVTVFGSGQASLSVYDLSGRLVAVPFAGELEGSASFGLGTLDLAPGVYFMRLEGPGSSASARVTVLR